MGEAGQRGEETFGDGAAEQVDGELGGFMTIRQALLKYAKAGPALLNPTQKGMDPSFTP